VTAACPQYAARLAQTTAVVAQSYQRPPVVWTAERHQILTLRERALVSEGWR
jgi:hypothetical protein